MKRNLYIALVIIFMIPFYYFISNKGLESKMIKHTDNLYYEDNDADVLTELPSNLENQNGSVTSTDSLFCQELLGRPTSTSITIHACSHPSYNVYYEYGLDSMNYLNQTSTITTIDSIPFVVTINGLTPNTQYFYRMKYRIAGGTTFLTRSSHTFHTARSSGSAFTFSIQADPHCDTNTNYDVYSLTLQNMKLRNPDFLIDMGDIFMSEKLTTFNSLNVRSRMLLLRSYYDKLCHSVPLFLVIGNHEGELGWFLDSTANNMPVITANMRNKYYINPEPNSFYSGDTSYTQNVGLRRSYYSWEWGNCLFVVIDPFWNTLSKPAWGWTLGKAQFDWFKKVISTSTAEFKFVFCHNLIGGYGNDGRGGSEAARFYEQGGYNSDSVTWGFDTYRPGWGGKPIHQLMVENKVNIFFHGHDHYYGYQRKDNVIYQELPQPSTRGYTQQLDPTYGYRTGVFIPCRGYMAVTVTGTTAKFDYVRTFLPSEEAVGRHNLDVAYSYTIDTANTTTSINENNSVQEIFYLNQNYPNPFNPATSIKFQIGSSRFVKLAVYDILGKEVEILVNKKLNAGTYEINWNALNYPSGVYFYRLTSDGFSDTKRMLLIK